MPRKPKGLNKPIAKTAARMSRKAALTPAQLEKLDAYWRASNYLSACQLYLLDNPLLKQPLEPAHIKKKIVGHWGTVPGQNFIYTHLNRIINKYDLDMIYLSGPGHGGNAMVAQTYLEGSYSEIYPNISQDLEGMQKLFKQFSFPGGIPSHVAPETPGSIHEGGELGYSLSHAFGAVLDNPDLIAACVVGDGEAETGPLATAWHGNKFLNPIGDGAVLPILHLNGFKIHNPTILSRISHGELESFFRGCGWEPRFVEGDDPKTMHQTMAAALDWAIREIKRIQANARTTGDDSRPTWPMIVLRSPKGWTGPKEVDGATIEGSFRAHQVPIDMSQPHHLQLLESWLRSYKPEELFTDEGKLRPELQALAPKGDRRMGANHRGRQPPHLAHDRPALPQGLDRPQRGGRRHHRGLLPGPPGAHRHVPAPPPPAAGELAEKLQARGTLHRRGQAAAGAAGPGPQGGPPDGGQPPRQRRQAPPGA